MAMLEEGCLAVPFVDDCLKAPMDLYCFVILLEGCFVVPLDEDCFAMPLDEDCIAAPFDEDGLTALIDEDCLAGPFAEDCLAAPLDEVCLAVPLDEDCFIAPIDEDCLAVPFDDCLVTPVEMDCVAAPFDEECTAAPPGDSPPFFPSFREAGPSMARSKAWLRLVCLLLLELVPSRLLSPSFLRLFSSFLLPDDDDLLAGPDDGGFPVDNLSSLEGDLRKEANPSCLELLFNANWNKFSDFSDGFFRRQSRVTGRCR